MREVVFVVSNLVGEGFSGLIVHINSHLIVGDFVNIFNGGDSGYVYFGDYISAV